MGTSNNIVFNNAVNAIPGVFRLIVALFPISLLVIVVNLLILGLLIIG